MQKQLLSMSVLLIAAGLAVPAFAEFTLSVGVQSSELDVESRNKVMGPPNSGIDIDRTESNNDTSLGGEVALGYQYDFATDYDLAIELFGQFSGADTAVPIEADSLAPMFQQFGLPDEDAHASFDWMAGIRLRPGYNVTPSTRFFIDGGVLLGSFEMEYSDAMIEQVSNLLTTNFASSETETLFGWRYGVGVEYKVTHNFMLGVDYAITEFNEFTSDFVEDAAAAALPQHQTHVDAESKYTPTFYTWGLNFKYAFGAKQPKRHAEMKDK